MPICFGFANFDKENNINASVVIQVGALSFPYRSGKMNTNNLKHKPALNLHILVPQYPTINLERMPRIKVFKKTW